MINDFIYEKHNLLSKQECEEIIRLFEKNDSSNFDGFIGSGINKAVKQSTDFCFHLSNKSLNRRLYGDIIQDMLDGMLVELYKYMDKYSVFQYTSISVDSFNIQRYKPGEGFHAWHYETTEETVRLFVWMIYLNDVPDGGTKFMMQDRTIKAEEGKLVFFPADWTHTHKGEVSQTSTKYILTGWISLLDSNVSDKFIN